VQEAIEWHLPADEFEKLKVAEESEREFLLAWASKLPEAAP
jgi:hypothetical protein